MTKKRKNMYIYILVLVIAVVSLSIAYAAVKTTLTIKFGKTTGKPITWDVGFNEAKVNGIANGTSDTGRSCGIANVTKEDVIIESTTLSKPADSCLYPLVIENYGGIIADIVSITPETPEGIDCSLNKTPTMTCGNLTYQLSNDMDGSSKLENGQKIGINEKKTVYLIVTYTGANVNNTPVTQTKAGFKINYAQK